MKTRIQLLVISVAVIVVILAPQSSRAQDISGSWNGLVSGSYYTTQGGEILASGQFGYENMSLSLSSAPGGFDISFTYPDVGYPLGLPLFGTGDLGPGPNYGIVNGGTSTSDTFESFTFGFTYQSISPSGEIDFTYGPDSAILNLTYFQSDPSADPTNPYPVVKSESLFFEAFPPPVPEPSSIVMMGAAALLGLVYYASARRFQALKNLVVRR
jgi:hypothetical protein